MTQKEMSRREERAMLFIKAYIAANGYAPSMKEIMVAIGLSSTASTMYVLEALEGKGYIRRTFNVPRSIVVL